MMRATRRTWSSAAAQGQVNALAFGEDDEAACREEAAMLPKQEAIANEVSAEIEKRRGGARGRQEEGAAAA